MEHHLLDGDRPLTWAEVAARLQTDKHLRTQLTQRIAECEHDAVFWETVPVSRETTSTPFAFHLTASPALAEIEADRHPFPGALAGPEPVATFYNLGGDALLVSPKRQGPRHWYPHLTAFVRNAPDGQIHALWAAVGAAAEAVWAERTDPVWVSTSGLGVPWLHVRLDRRPKYYTVEAYRKWPQG